MGVSIFYERRLLGFTFSPLREVRLRAVTVRQQPAAG